MAITLKEKIMDYTGLAFKMQELQADVIYGAPAVSGAATFASTVGITGVLTPTGGVAAAGGFSVSPRNWHTGNAAPTQTTDGTDATPSTTETYFAEIFIPCNATLTGASIFNGSAVGSDKLVLILWNSTGAAVANTATAGTTASGTDAYQKIAFTATYAAKGPATYFLGMQCDGTTYRFNTHILGTFGADKKTSTVFGTIPSITAPTTFTTALGPYMSLY